MLDADDTETAETTEVASDTPTAGPDASPVAPWGRPIVDTSRVTAGLVRALVAAQRAAKTVGKDKTNQGGGGEDRGGTKAYKYASADHLIAVARGLLSAEGIAWVSGSRLLDPPRIEFSAKQWVCSLVRSESVLLHADDAGAVGELRITGECISVGSSARPPDKADKAADTYLRGFLARDLLALDRGEVDANEDVDARHDSDADAPAAGGGRAARGKPASSAVRDEVNNLVRSIAEAEVAAGRERPAAADVVRAVMGDRFARPSDDAGFRRLRDALAKHLASAMGGA